jgi:hypothetical protein
MVRWSSPSNWRERLEIEVNGSEVIHGKELIFRVWHLGIERSAIGPRPSGHCINELLLRPFANAIDFMRTNIPCIGQERISLCFPEGD